MRDGLRSTNMTDTAMSPDGSKRRVALTDSRNGTSQSGDSATASSSCIYVGTVHHRRYAPVIHAFRYSLFLAYIDLDEVDTLFRYPRCFSTARFSAIRFRRGDYLGDPNRPLVDCVRELVLEKTGKVVMGPIRLLTQLRTFGFVFNPVSLYYCFDSDTTTLTAVVADVTNTPWGERHCYVLSLDSNHPKTIAVAECPKEFHVSPFMEMAMQYRWRLSQPAEQLTVRIENHDKSGLAFDATLQLTRHELTLKNLSWTLLCYPMMAWKVIAAIYWQAFRLWRKKVPLVPHPSRYSNKVA
ncbi:MAG: DUF1365 domain-containing protein [Pirellulaceae bacterium]